MASILERIQISIPFTMLCETYLDRFFSYGLNPEIGFDGMALDAYSLSYVESIAKQFHDRGLTITLHAPFIDLSPGSPDTRIRRVTRERLEQVLRLIPALIPETVVCHAGYDEQRYWYIKDEWVKKSVEMWSWFGDRVVQEGSRLMLENVYEHVPDDMEVILKELGGQGVGFCLDTGHQSVFGHAPLETWLESLEPYLGQLHIHDNSGEVDSHLAIGHGEIDFNGFFRHLAAKRQEPLITTLEPHREEDLWPSLEYLEKVWPW